MTLRRAFVFVASILLAAAPSASRAAPEPFFIPVIVSQTGNATYIGKDEVIAFNALESYTNAHGGIRGRPIHFQIHDDASDPKVAVQLLNQLLTSNPAIVLGSTLNATCGAIAAITKEKGPVTYCFSPALQPERGGFAFAATASSVTLEGAIYAFARAKGYRRLALISSTDASGIANQKTSHTVLGLPENRAMQVVLEDNIAPDSTSAVAQATRIKAAHPDAIMAWVGGATFGTLLRSLNDSGVDIPVLTNGANSNPEQMKQYAAFLPRELYLPGFPFNLGEQALRKTAMASAAAAFYQAYRDASATPSPAATPYVWDVGLIVISAYRTLGFNATPEAIRNYISGLRHFVGIDGIYDFSIGDQHGLLSSSEVMLRWNPQAESFDIANARAAKSK